jgi:hypothetical protein
MLVWMGMVSARCRVRGFPSDGSWLMRKHSEVPTILSAGKEHQQCSAEPAESGQSRPTRSNHHLSDAVWVKSSRSNGNGGNNCVEVALLDSCVAVRDCKNPTGPALLFDPAEWTAFVDSAKSGEFDTI